jgi:DNA-binding PadR family transcriptional regulator
MKLTQAEMNTLRQCWLMTEGKAWEPRRGTNSKGIKRLVEAGYIRVVDGRCGFELLKDAMVDWTEAGRAALAASSVKPLELFDPKDEEAIKWITENLSGLRRDDGSIEYTLVAVVRAFQAGKHEAADS